MSNDLTRPSFGRSESCGRIVNRPPWRRASNGPLARMLTSPASGITKPATVIIHVVLPAPFRPTSPVIDPEGTASVKPLSAAWRPYFFTSPRVIIASFIGHPSSQRRHGRLKDREARASRAKLRSQQQAKKTSAKARHPPTRGIGERARAVSRRARRSQRHS